MKPEKTISAAKQFTIDEKSSIPVWLQLKKRFIYLITSGFYLPDDQLPTVRGLAADIEVNYNTISKVYQSLEEDGYIISKRRQGAFVADVSGKLDVDAAVTAEIVTTEYLKRCQELGMSLEDINAQFKASLAKAKKKRGKGQGDQDDTQEEKRGSVIVFPNDAEAPSERTSGNGA